MDKKLTDSEVVKAREVSLKEQIEHYNKRQKEVFDNYYCRNTEGNEDTLEICVLRESSVLISKLESIINRLQAENERLKNSGIRANSVDDWLKHCNELRTEAYKEFAERIHCHCESIINQPHNERVKPSSWKVAYEEFDEYNDNLLKELVGEDNEKM